MSPDLAHLVFDIAKHHQLFLYHKDYYKVDVVGVHASTYSDLSSQFLGAPLKLHKFWFCANDMNCCAGGMKCRYAVERSIVLSIWHVQEGTNLSHNEVKALEEVGFVINIQQPIFPQSFFVEENFVPINLLVDAMPWPKTKSGKLVRHTAIYHIKTTLQLMGG